MRAARFGRCELLASHPSARRVDCRFHRVQCHERDSGHNAAGLDRQGDAAVVVEYRRIGQHMVPVVCYERGRGGFPFRLPDPLIGKQVMDYWFGNQLFSLLGFGLIQMADHRGEIVGSHGSEEVPLGWSIESCVAFFLSSGETAVFEMAFELFELLYQTLDVRSE